LSLVTELVKSFEDCSQNCRIILQQDVSYKPPPVTIGINPTLAPFKSIRTSPSPRVHMSQFLLSPEPEPWIRLSHAAPTFGPKTFPNSFLARRGSSISLFNFHARGPPVRGGILPSCRSPMQTDWRRVAGVDHSCPRSFACLQMDLQRIFLSL
jgi:hypothetical protein